MRTDTPTVRQPGETLGPASARIVMVCTRISLSLSSPPLLYPLFREWVSSFTRQLDGCAQVYGVFVCLHAVARSCAQLCDFAVLFFRIDYPPSSLL